MSVATVIIALVIIAIVWFILRMLMSYFQLKALDAIDQRVTQAQREIQNANDVYRKEKNENYLDVDLQDIWGRVRSRIEPGKKNKNPEIGMFVKLLASVENFFKRHHADAMFTIVFGHDEDVSRERQDLDRVDRATISQLVQDINKRLSS